MLNPLGFSVVIEQFAALRVQVNDEWHAMKAIAAGPKLVVSAEELVKAGSLAEKAPLGRALRKFLKTLPDDQLFALLALIYAGRDKKPNPVAYWHSTIRSTVQSRSAAIEVVLDKEQAAEYVRRAIESFAPGLELEALPSLLSIPT